MTLIDRVILTDIVLFVFCYAVQCAQPTKTNMYTYIACYSLMFFPFLLITKIWCL